MTLRLFFSVLGAFFVGSFIYYVYPKVKAINILGITIFTVAFGLLIRYRGLPDSHVGMIAAQVLLDISCVASQPSSQLSALPADSALS